MIEKKSSMIRGGIIGYAVMAICLCLTIYPLIWMILGSLKTSGDFYTNIWGLPSQWIWGNYAEAWNRAEIGMRYLNSIIVTGTYLCINIPLVCCAAYAFARLKFKGRKQLYTFMLLGIMIPTGVLTLPIYSTLVSYGLTNSRLGLSIAYAGSSMAFGTFMMRSFFISLPKGLEEAARIDGATSMKAFTKVILPLTKPGIMILVIYNGLSVWTEYQMAYLTLGKHALQTLPIGIVLFQGNESIARFCLPRCPWLRFR